MDERKGLAVIYDPHNLYQFAWYYCNQGKNKRWDALCLPNGYKGEYMHTYCEKAGVFEDIYKDEQDFSTLSSLKKILEALKMFFYFIIGKRRNYCRKIVGRYVNVDLYDEIVVLTSVGYVSGACVALGKEKKVIILEDGAGDYTERKKHISRRYFFSTYYWQGFLLAKMGYCCPGWYYFKPEGDCIKYCSHPDKMKNTYYKEMRQLYSSCGTDMKLFDEITKRIYPQLKEYDFDKTDALVFTESLEDFVSDTEKYKNRFEEFISNQYKAIVLKRHPREKTEYVFASNISVTEINNSIPAEAILPYVSGKEIVLTNMCSIALYLGAYNLKCKVFVYEGLFEESIKSNARFRPPTLSEMREYYEEFNSGKYEMVSI